MTKSMRTDLTVAAAIFRRMKNDLFNPYRPELHYMRGPGPKWREKWGQGPVGTQVGTQVR
jgi:hypothetical protein